MTPRMEQSLHLLIKIAIVIMIGLAVYLFVIFFWPLCALLLKNGIKVSLPFIIAYLIGTLLHPSITYFEEKFHLQRSWGTLITIVSSFFFARDYNLIRENAVRLLPFRWQASFHKVAAGLRKAFYGYIKAELVLTAITGMISLIGLIILRVNYAHILAIMAALTDFVPIVGPGALYLPWGIWVLFTGNVRLGIGLMVLYGIIVVVRQLVEPKIVGQSIGLHPLTTLISLYFGLSLLGVWGLILGPAVMIAYKAFSEK